jgi:hypothetical protein
VGILSVPRTDEPIDDELAIGVQRGKRPEVAVPRLGRVPLLRPDK